MWATADRVLLLASIVVAVLTWSPDVGASVPRVQIRGSTRLEVRASGPGSRIQVSGTLRDETGTPVPDALMVLRAMADDLVSVPWEALGSCAEDGPLVSGSRAELTVTTDAMGAFCLIAALRRDEAVVRTVYGGGPLHEGTRSDVQWNAQQRPVSVRFSPRPERIDLDAARAIVFARAITAPGTSPRGLKLDLAGDDDRVVATAVTDDTGAAHFDFPTSSLTGPGIGALRLRFAGQADLAPATATATVTRTVRVRLSTEGMEVRGDPVRGIPVRIAATTSRGPVNGGTVEATLAQDVIGAGSVVDGYSDVMLTFRPRREDPTYGVTFRYRSDAPYYEQSGTLRISVVAEQPSPWLRAVPIVIVAAVAAWLLRGWWRPKRRERRPTPRAAVTGQPSLAVLGPSGSRELWSGRVVDAHDGGGIRAARVRVIVPTFVELDVVQEVEADEDGRFEFVVRSSEKELRLRVESTYHASFEKQLPPPSHMVVALVSRRRALLERLVKWARGAGKPWHREPDATPAHVAQVARARYRRGEPVAEWAERVQQGAFGPDPVDERLEQEVNELEPGGQPLR